MPKISCIRCGARIQNTLEAYADHIRKKHSDDLEWCRWAVEELAKIGKYNNGNPHNEPRYMGKLLSHIPPRREKKLPKYLRRQLPE